MKRCSYFLIFVVIPFLIKAQTGTIKGKAMEGINREVLSGVTVRVAGHEFSSITDTSGLFEIRSIPAGKHNLIFTNYLNESDTLFNVEVKVDDVTLVDMTLKPTKNSLNEVQITYLKTFDTDVELIKKLKTMNQVASGISSEQINKGQDRDASEAVRRISGVALNSDRFIIVRGLSERYNAVWLNNIAAPSSEADKKAFSFDVIPSSLVDQIIVYKSPSAELPGDFAGGMIKVFTKTAPLGQSLVFDVNGFYRPGSTGQTQQFTEGSKTDFLGYDNGFRASPVGIPDQYEQSNTTLTKQFKNTWILHDKKAIPDSRLSFNYSLGFKVKKVQIGSVTGFNYSNQNSLYTIRRTTYESPVANIVPEDPTVTYNDVQSTNLVRMGGMQNFMVVFNPSNKLEFKNLFSQTGRNQSTVRTGTDEGANVLYYGFGYQSKTLLSSQLEYGYVDKNNKNNYTISLGYSLNNRNDPDLRRITYQYPPDTMFRTNIPPGSGQLDVTEGATRFFSKLSESIYSINQSYKHTFSISTYSFNVLVGAYTEYKSRTFTSRLFGYTLPPSYLRRGFTALPINEIFSNQYIDATDTSYGQHRPAGFKIYDATSPSDSYSGQNQLIAPFVSLELPISKRLRLISGLRVEDNTRFLQTVVGVDTVHLKTNSRYYLPSFNLKYDFAKNSVVRLAYGKTLNRPEFREAAPFLYYDFELMALSHGALFPSIDHPGGVTLKTATIQNFDFRYEFYPSANEMLSVGLFYKKFLNPIEQISEAHEHRTGVSLETTFHNSDAAFCYGIELDIRKSLASLGKFLGTSVFKNLSFISNVSLIKSQVYNANEQGRRSEGRLGNPGLAHWQDQCGDVCAQDRPSAQSLSEWHAWMQ